jgi:folate-binding protein YgfZ
MGPSPVLFDLTGRGAVVLTGRDRASFLHGLVTNDIKKLTPGTGCAAAFLTSKGKLLADCVVLCEEDRLEIDCEPELAGKIEDLLRKYLVFNEVQIGNLTSEAAVLHLQHSARDAVEELLEKVTGLGPAGALPKTPHAHVMARIPFEEKPTTPETSQAAGDEEGIPVRLISESRTLFPGYDLRFPCSRAEAVRRALFAAGAQPAPLDRLEALRIEAGIPRWGFELTEAVLPDEAGLRERGFISDNKGCYIGQETVARIKTYGHVNRNLVRLFLEGETPASGSEIFFEGENAGAVTSAARAAGSGPATALGYVRRERAAPGTRLLVRTRAGDRPATVAAPPVA